MTNEEQYNRRLSGQRREETERMVEAGLKKTKAYQSSQPPTDGDKVVEKMKQIHLDVFATMRPILDESNKKGIVDRQADKEMLATLFLQQLESRMTKDELVYMLTSLIVEQAWEK